MMIVNNMEETHDTKPQDSMLVDESSVPVNEDFISNADFISFESSEAFEPLQDGLQGSVLGGGSLTKKRPWSSTKDRNSLDGSHKQRATKENTAIKTLPMSSLMKKGVPWLRLQSTKAFENYVHLAPSFQLHEEIKRFVKYISPSAQEKKSRASVFSRVKSVILGLWPEAKVSAFGSFYTDLYLPTSDIDVVVCCEFSNNSSPLRKVARALLKNNLVQENRIKIISKTRVPLVKFTERHTNFVVDISFNQESGVEGSDNINFLVDAWPALKPLLLVLKQFLLGRALNEVFSGGLSSYSLTLMLVSFFQIHPLIQYKLIIPEQNLGVLLVEFFELFGKCWHYERVGISVAGPHGHYYNKYDRESASNSTPNRSFLLSIEDPHSPDNDVSKSSFSIISIKQAFQHAYQVLSSLLIELNRSNAPPNIKNKNAVPSILSCIINVSEKSIQHRSYIEKLGDATLS